MPKISFDQTEIDSLFFNLKENSCIDSIIQSLDNDKSFKNVKYKYTLRPTYLLVDSSLDKYDSDSLKILLSKEISGFYMDYGMQLSQKIEIIRYYNNIQTVHGIYNEILTKLIKLKYTEYSEFYRWGNNDGSIMIDFDENKADILSTGFSLFFKESLHTIRLTIDYDNESTYGLTLCSVRKKIKCE